MAAARAACGGSAVADYLLGEDGAPPGGPPTSGAFCSAAPPPSPSDAVLRSWSAACPQTATAAKPAKHNLQRAPCFSCPCSRAGGPPGKIARRKVKGKCSSPAQPGHLEFGSAHILPILQKPGRRPPLLVLPHGGRGRPGWFAVGLAAEIRLGRPPYRNLVEVWLGAIVEQLRDISSIGGGFVVWAIGDLTDGRT